VQSASNLQLRAESQPDKKSAKKGKKKKKKGQSAQVRQEVPSAIPAGAPEETPYRAQSSKERLQTLPEEIRISSVPQSFDAAKTKAGPSETEQQNGKGSRLETNEPVVETRQDPPAALLGRNFSEETSSLAKLRKVGAGTNELTSAYVMGLLFAQPPKRVAEWCELAPSQVQAYLAEHGEEGTWWLFTLDLLRWPQPRFAAMSELLQRPENRSFAAVIESMALAALTIRANEYGKQRAVAREGYFALKKPEERLTLHKATAAMKKILGHKTELLSLLLHWMRLTAAEVGMRQTLLEARIRKMIPHSAVSSDGLLATIHSLISNEIMQGAAPSSSDGVVLATVARDGQMMMEKGEDLLAEQGTLRKSKGGELDLLREGKVQLADVFTELMFGLNLMRAGPEQDYEPASLQSGFTTWLLVRFMVLGALSCQLVSATSPSPWWEGLSCRKGVHCYAGVSSKVPCRNRRVCARPYLAKEASVVQR
jgi:hypothetical protein